jgi:F0F1-type ATP synthase membrane subunit c/vacuolar-type H+-ATPase subunit K
MPDPRNAAFLVLALPMVIGSSVGRLDAQQLSPSLSNLEYTAHPGTTTVHPRLELGDTAKKYPRTYWLEGALLAGIPLGLLGAALGGGLCGDPDSPGGGSAPCWDDALLGLVSGVGVGASLGGLIGGLIKKPEKKKDQETIRDESP